MATQQLDLKKQPSVIETLSSMQDALSSAFQDVSRKVADPKIPFAEETAAALTMAKLAEAFITVSDVREARARNEKTDAVFQEAKRKRGKLGF